MTPKITLIIPIYNAQTYLKECLDSVAAQTVFADVQVLLIDDGSADASPQICDDFAAEYENVQVQHRRNAGVSAARNAGLDAAKGAYIAFADADDLLLPQMLEKLLNAAEQTGAQLALCPFYTDPPEGRLDIVYPFPEETPFEKQKLADFMLQSETCNALWNKLFVRQLIEKNKIRMTVGKRLGEDREFILRYLAVCGTVCYTPSLGYFYRYVTTGAIRRPQSGYAGAITAQYASDETLFGALGMEKNAFREKCALCLCTRIGASIDLISRGFSGRRRRAELRAFYADDALQQILASLLPIASRSMQGYSVRLLRCMQRRNVRQTCFLTFLLRVRTRLYAMLRGK